MLAIFSVVTVLTIAIVCANVANLLIARAVVRQREIALQAIARRLAHPHHPRSACGRSCPVGGRVDRGVSVRLDRVQNGREAAGAGRAKRYGDAGSGTGLDGGRLRARAGPVVHDGRHARSGRADVAAATAPFLEGRRTKRRAGAFDAVARAGRAAVGVFRRFAHDSRARAPIVVAARQRRRRIRHQESAARHREHVSQCQ